MPSLIVRGLFLGALLLVSFTPIEARSGPGLEAPKQCIEILRLTDEGRLTEDRLVAILSSKREPLIARVLHEIRAADRGSHRRSIEAALQRMAFADPSRKAEWETFLDGPAATVATKESCSEAFVRQPGLAALCQAMGRREIASALKFSIAESCAETGSSFANACVEVGLDRFREVALWAAARPLLESEGDPTIIRKYLDIEPDLVRASFASLYPPDVHPLGHRFGVLVDRWVQPGVARPGYPRPPPSRWAAWADILESRLDGSWRF